ARCASCSRAHRSKSPRQRGTLFIWNNRTYLIRAFLHFASPTWPGPARRMIPRRKSMTLAWEKIKDYQDILFEKAEGIARITINRPEVRNAFRPETLTEMIEAFRLAGEDPEVGVVILTGKGPEAFCAGGDQKVRGHGGYVGKDGVPRLNALDLQRTIKYLPKPVIAMVAGYAIGGGPGLHPLSDPPVAAEQARLRPAGPRPGRLAAGGGGAGPS